MSLSNEFDSPEPHPIGNQYIGIRNRKSTNKSSNRIAAHSGSTRPLRPRSWLDDEKAYIASAGFESDSDEDSITK